MTTPTFLSNFDHEQHDWTQTTNASGLIDYTREHDAHDENGCKRCDGHQNDDWNDAGYCPHQDDDTYTERVELRPDHDEVNIWEDRFQTQSFPYTQTNILAYLRGNPENINYQAESNTLDTTRTSKPAESTQETLF